MKKILLLTLLVFGFYSQAQMVPSNVRVNLSPYYLTVEVWNMSMYNANCRGFVTALNMQTNRYIQIYYNQFVWSQSIGYQNYYLGPYNNGMYMRLLNYNIQCFAGF